ncbi:MAG: cation transporter [Candidatus Micrarchaeota archaeon]
MGTKNKNDVNKALFAQYLLLGYNITEAAVSLFFGSVAGSIALISFGLDSAIESASTLIVTWRLKKTGTCSQEKEAVYEKRAFRWVGYSFMLLAVYVVFESGKKLVLNEAPEASVPGIAIALASILFMPRLAKYRHDLGHRINCNSLIADSKQTMLCVYMSIALLAGIGFNMLLGWWWADPLVGFVIAALAVNEGKRALEGKTCC